MQDMNGRCAVVTGGGSGIGRAVGLALAREGALVVIADILPENARGAADEIEARGGRALPVVCDVSDRESVAALKTAANAAFGRVGLLVANAGATAFERLTDMSDPDVDWIFQANLLGVTNCLRAFLPDMYAAREGHVVATASGAGLQPTLTTRMSVYAAAKAGIIGLMLALRAEAAEFGVGTTVVCPGGVQSSMLRDNARYRPARFGGPGDGELPMPVSPDSVSPYRPASDVADMVLEAVRGDHPMVLTDAALRALYLSGEAAVVLGAFDRLDAFEARLGGQGV